MAWIEASHSPSSLEGLPDYINIYIYIYIYICMRIKDLCLKHCRGGPARLVRRFCF